MVVTHPTPIVLRDACLDDAPMLLAWELQPELQNVTRVESSVTLDFICRHILSSVELFEDCQKRFIIDCNGLSVGVIDLYDYADSVASVGIFVDNAFRQRGYASKALQLVIKYAREKGVTTLCAEVQRHNIASMALFCHAGFNLIADSQNEEVQNLRLDL